MLRFQRYATVLTATRCVNKMQVLRLIDLDCFCIFVSTPIGMCGISTHLEVIWVRKKNVNDRQSQNAPPRTKLPLIGDPSVIPILKFPQQYPDRTPFDQ